MVTVRIAEPTKLKREVQCAYVRFNYNPDFVAKVKTLPSRFYLADSKEWEVPAKDLNLLLTAFSGTDVTVKGPSTTGLPLPVVSPTVPEVPKSGLYFKTNPFDHQIEGVQYGLSKKQFLLADEQGLGKTKQAIDIAVNLKEAGKLKKVLIVAGVNSLKWNWMKEIRTHSDEKAKVLGTSVNSKGKLKEGNLEDVLNDLKGITDLEEFFLIVNIEKIRVPKNKAEAAKTTRGKIQLELVNTLEKLTKTGEIGLVVIDEIHKAKNPTSQQGKAVHKAQSPYRIALTGTPLMNSPIDLYNILKWLGDDQNSNFYSFRSRYCELGGYGGYQIVGHKNLAELQARLERVQLRRLKEEVLNLPAKIRSVEYVELTGKQKQLYTEVKTALRANLAEISLSPNPLTQLIRLRQVTGNPGIISSQVTENAKTSRLIEILEELSASGKKAIVFSNWTDIINPLETVLTQYNPAVITGVTKDRMDQVEKFQSDPSCKVILGTIGAMGTGLTLTAGSTVIFMDKPWNLANTEQAEDRAHRIGTTGTVNVVTLVAEGTIDEKIEEIIFEKGAMAEALVDGKLDKLSKSQLLDRLLS